MSRTPFARNAFPRTSLLYIAAACLILSAPNPRPARAVADGPSFAPQRGLPTRRARAGDPFAVFGISGPMRKSRRRAAPCTQIYSAGDWIVEACPDDESVSTPMEVRLDGQPRGQAARVGIYHKSQNSPGTPQVVVIYASGFVRLKQNEDPATPIPFGSSFVLGPAYWTGPSAYFHNPQLRRLDIDTSLLPRGALRMRAAGANNKFDVSYEMVLPPPLDRETRLHVAQEYKATAAVVIDPVRRAESQGFKLVQVSSMFINQGGPCDFGHTDCHDSDGARYLAPFAQPREVAFTSLTLPSLVFNQPQPLGGRFLDVLHGDDQSWQGDTPNVRIELDALPQGHTVTPQGFIAATTNPNDDNVGLWLHDDGPASQGWSAGESARVGYWLIAQNDPPPALAAPTIRFSTEAVAVNENAGTAAVAVARSDDATGFSTIDYTTIDGTASERSDYTRAVGTLRFSPGEFVKHVIISISHDAFAEGAETVNLALSNPAGAAYGHPATAVLTINNVNSPLDGNPADDADFFVRQHYRDFLSREADAPGLAFWTNEITSCGADLQCREAKRVNVSAAFYLSIEFQETGYFAHRMYKAAYGDITGKPVPVRLDEFQRDTQKIRGDVRVGIGDWQEELELNKQLFASEFVARSRFTATYPLSLAPAALVDMLNTNAGGPLSQDERALLVNALTNGTLTRAQVLRAVAEDQTLRDAEFRKAFVLMQYFGYLRRNPDDADFRGIPDPNFDGWRFWLQKLDDFDGNFVDAEMVRAFISSIEYRGRFGPT